MFGDPNDVCLLINVGIMLSLYGVLSTRGILIRVMWLGPLVLFVWALKLTGSRGGFVAALAGVAVLLVSRFGIRRGALVAAIALPLIFSQVGGRQSDFNLSDRENTGQLRIQLWSDAMEVFKSSPLFGAGPNQTMEKSTRLFTIRSSNLIPTWGFRRNIVCRGFLSCLPATLPTPMALKPWD